MIRPDSRGKEIIKYHFWARRNLQALLVHFVYSDITNNHAVTFDCHFGLIFYSLLHIISKV